MVYIQMLKLLVISLSNKESVPEFSLETETISSKKTGNLLNSELTSLKPQLLSLKCKPPKEEILLVSECKTYPMDLVKFSLKKNNPMMMILITLLKLLVGSLS